MTKRGAIAASTRSTAVRKRKGPASGLFKQRVMQPNQMTKKRSNKPAAFNKKSRVTRLPKRKKK